MSHRMQLIHLCYSVLYSFLYCVYNDTSQLPIKNNRQGEGWLGTEACIQAHLSTFGPGPLPVPPRCFRAGPGCPLYVLWPRPAIHSVATACRTGGAWPVVLALPPPLPPPSAPFLRPAGSSGDGASAHPTVCSTTGACQWGECWVGTEA